MWFEEFSDTLMFATMGKIFFNRFVAPKVLKQAGDADVADAAVATELPPLLDYLEGVVPEGGGFLIGDRITLADIAVASPFVNLGHVGCPIDPARWPKTAAYVRGILARPSFAPIIEREQAFVARVG